VAGVFSAAQKATAPRTAHEEIAKFVFELPALDMAASCARPVPT
jgi:hypothetical protein